MSEAQGPEDEWLVPAVEDNRQMCFEQGKACVYEPDDERGIIVTEWPNGVVDRTCLRTKTTTRRWPDGSEETGSEDGEWEFPHWPRPTSG